MARSEIGSRQITQVSAVGVSLLGVVRVWRFFGLMSRVSSMNK